VLALLITVLFKLKFASNNSAMKIITITTLFLLFVNGFAQTTVSWNGYTGGNVGTAFNSGTAPNNMSATVTKNNCTQGDGTPKYVATNPSTPCYISGSLALNANTFSSATSANNAHYTVTMTFNPGFSGTCNYAQFTIMDINSDESNQTFCDVLEISAVDGNGNAITATTNALGLPTGGGITSTMASNVNRSLIGTTILKLTGHNSSTETTGSFTSGSACGSTTIRVKAPDNVPLQSITIKYRPAYGTSTSNAYYSFSTIRPANQYISISNITLTPTGGSCEPLPIRLKEFNVERINKNVLFDWSSASELNNDYYILEESSDGIVFNEVAKIKGAGNSNTNQSYTFELINNSNNETYYKLFQTDYDGTRTYLDTKVVSGIISGHFSLVELSPNPAKNYINLNIYSDQNTISSYQIFDLQGNIVVNHDDLRFKEGLNQLQISTSSLKKGLYFLKMDSHFNSESIIAKFIIE
jgi:hypothetical protein